MTDSESNMTKDYLWPPALTGEFPDDQELFFPCPNCARGVPFTIRSQQRLSQAGVGHRCPNCRRYVALVVGSCCNEIFPVDQETWKNLAQEKPTRCLHCDTELYLKARSNPALGVSFRTMPLLYAYSDNASETVFVAAAKNTMDKNQLNMLAVSHQTTYERLSLAEKQVGSLQSMALISPFGIFNNPELEDSALSHSTSNIASLPNLVFQVSTALFSAVESLAQEVNVIIGMPWKEHLVSYNSFGDIPPNYAELHESCSRFLKQPDFLYLKNLRNVSQHRRITTLATDATYLMHPYSPIEPGSLKSESIHYLPDNPSAKYGTETYAVKREVQATLVALTEETREFLYRTYQLCVNVLDSRNINHLSPS